MENIVFGKLLLALGGLRAVAKRNLKWPQPATLKHKQQMDNKNSSRKFMEGS